MKFLLSLVGLLMVNGLYAQDLSRLSYAQLDSLMQIAYGQSDLNTCVTYSKISRDKAKAEFGALDSIYTEYTSNLGYFYNQLGKNDLAEPLFIEAKEIREKTLGKKHYLYPFSLNNLGSLYQDIGKYEDAEQLYLEAMSLQATILGKESADYAQTLNNLAYLYHFLGNLTQAEPVYIEALTIWGKIFGKEHPSYALALSNLAKLYNDMGNYDQSEKYFLEVKTIHEKILPPLHPAYASTLNNLAALYQTMGKYAESERFSLQTIEIEVKLGNKEHRFHANSLTNLASLYQKLHRYKEAEKLLLEAKSIYEKILGKEHLHYGVSLYFLSALYGNMNNNTLSWDYWQQAATIFSGIAISNQVSLAWSDSLLQAQYTSNSHLENMIISLQTVYQLLKNQKESQIIVADLANQLLQKSKNSFVSEQDKLRTLSKSHQWMLLGLKVLDPQKQVAKAFEMAELNKSTLLLEAANTSQAHQFGNLPDSLIKQEKDLLKKQARLEANLMEKHPQALKDSLRTVLNGVNQEMRSFTKNIKEKFPQYAAMKYENKTAGITDIQAVLNNKTALLEYVIGDSCVFIFYIDKKQSFLEQKYISNKILATKIKELHGILSNYQLLSTDEESSYKKYTEHAYWFYQNLIPVGLKGKAITDLIIVADGELGHLPFEAFLVEPAPQKRTEYTQLHYLINDYNISYNYSATLFAEGRSSTRKSPVQQAQGKKNNGQILGMAANYTHQSDSSSSLRLPAYRSMRDGLIALPAARNEVEVLANSFNGFFAFDKEASEKTFKEKAGDYAIIHLAMHGLLDNKAPILSSLAFTEDGDSVENNFLQAYEISKMNLNADLVVLSACETGYGKFEKGNGIASLARAFMYAGASSLVVSLWQVNDFSTAEIMKNLYQNLSNGMPKDVALRQAKLDYMKVAKGIAGHPAFWSPFILMGNTDGITLGRTQVFAPTWIIGIGLIILGGIAFVIRRKKSLEA